ncbi:hypothetical protein [Oscillatoria nigro-viridis]|uniref:hypothetical protein n=1 Tax=Phormidium nigroviride TaxID=482564 RepID=UPI000300D4D7|nr:hypothetical protein [Oscillatoria nigro-viridis]
MSRSSHDICHGRSNKGRVFGKLAIDRNTIEVERLETNCDRLASPNLEKSIADKSLIEIYVWKIRKRYVVNLY